MCSSVIAAHNEADNIFNTRYIHFEAHKLNLWQHLYLTGSHKYEILYHWHYISTSALSEKPITADRKGKFRGNMMKVTIWHIYYSRQYKCWIFVQDCCRTQLPNNFLTHRARSSHAIADHRNVWCVSGHLTLYSRSVRGCRTFILCTIWTIMHRQLSSTRTLK
jgi:hypothetical protein